MIVAQWTLNSTEKWAIKKAFSFSKKPVSNSNENVTIFIVKNLLFLQVGYNTVYIITICLGKKKKVYMHQCFYTFI